MRFRLDYLYELSRLHQSELSEVHCLWSDTQDSTSRCIWTGHPSLLEALTAKAGEAGVGRAVVLVVDRSGQAGRQDRPGADKKKSLSESKVLGNKNKHIEGKTKKTDPWVGRAAQGPESLFLSFYLFFLLLL